MNVTEIKSEGLKKVFKVSVPAQDVEKETDAKINQIAKRVKLPGFRPGKAPVAMVKKQYKDSVTGEVLEDLVKKSTDNLIKEQNLRPAMLPDIKITAFGDGKDLEFEVSVENMPEIKVGSFSGIKLDKFMAEVPAEEVEKALKYLAQTRREVVKISDDRAAKKGDTTVINFVGSVDGVEFQGGKGESYPLELGSGSFIPGFEDQLIGKKAGEKVDVKVTFPKEYHAKDLAGKDAVFAVEILEIREPKEVEINDEFAKSLGEESLDKVKEVIAGRIKGDYEQASKMKLKRQLLDVLDKEYSFDVPAGLVDAEFNSICQQYEQAKKYNQLDEEEKSKSEDELKAEYKNIAIRRVKLGLLLSEVGKEAKINIAPEDINNAIMAEARKYPGQEKAVFDYYLKNKEAVEALKAPVFEEKIVNYIISQTKVNEKIVSVEELYKFDEEAKPAKKSAKKSAEKAEAKAKEKPAKKEAAKKETAKKTVKKSA
ncbi:MAG: trigger factor [Alphaproteobacteria bacterium]|nr:trigger factor [Alphaproteobacteria bacterium]